MLGVLSGFVAHLREVGLPVSVSEHLDAAAAMHHIPLEDRAALKAALAATLVKSANHRVAFDTAFEVWFALRREGDETGAAGTAARGEEAGAVPGLDQEAGRGEGWSGGRQGMGGAPTPDELADMVLRALRGGDDGLARLAARQAVARYAGMEPGRPVGGTYYLYRTLRQLDLDGLLARLLAESVQAREPAPRPPGGDGAPAAAGQGAVPPITALEERLLADEYRARVQRLRQEIESEIRRRLVADRGAAELARSLRTTLPEDVDVMHAGREELIAMRRALQPLSRKLAVHLARKRRHGRRGALDFRSTVRHSLSTGGVPIEPRFRYPRPAKPEILVVADISGSVASFARFTLHLVHAISTQFSKVRSFVFIDGIDEVTALFEGAGDPAEAVHRVTVGADVVWLDGHSDYGNALVAFWERWGEEITPRSSVLLLGDARNNYHASHAWVLGEIRHRARHLYWLNPEPRSYWGSGDSIIDEYAVHCDKVVECRTLRQLERFVGELA